MQKRIQHYNLQVSSRVEGLAISEADVKALAGLPSKDQLVAQVVSLIAITSTRHGQRAWRQFARTFGRHRSQSYCLSLAINTSNVANHRNNIIIKENING
ncbi:hypothetical protein KOY49_02120 [Candidatus Minimicrobia vallesae]|uniref:Uncharacterized protein n=1 Tax=Candidatus Minimicrobia vallesae TaxID=2841264 RepID=A0A8F1MBG6_9BACT|nr:hypothetical protein [Candidatus Minimicrobia vallesae]QWQ31772.1 hypothetical protein KOY49_02120 [Candidatus Minimicrobia vallesae]